ncbi:hypothetical protein SAMN05444166_1768 [Singulisphaera sp. GP187]|nr:hypothetical protein SAMN05444166_1768 [Singulisphaera sp. GP187]
MLRTRLRAISPPLDGSLSFSQLRIGFKQTMQSEAESHRQWKLVPSSTIKELESGEGWFADSLVGNSLISWTQ